MKRKFVWLEEFKCGCSNIVKVRKDAIGYCPIHGEDRRRITHVPEIEEGYVRA